MTDLIKILLGAALVCPVNVMAQEDAPSDSLQEDKIPVAFSEKPASDVMGGIRVLDYKELTKKNYNTYSLDNMPGYINGFNGTLWANESYLVLVDGVPREASDVMPTEIDKITFLKSAAAVALYGSQGAKGVILITTKKGGVGPLRINGRANVGLNAAKRYPKYLGSAQYMTLYNEARVNDGLDPLYSDEDIYNYGSGINPYRYPNVDFYSDDYIRKTYWEENGNIDIEGGSDKARFFANIDYEHYGTVFKFGQAKKNYSQRLSFRGNIDLNISDWVSATIHSNVIFYNSHGTNNSDFWSAASTLRPNRVSPLIPISYVDQNNADALTMLANSSNIIDGKYFLGGTQLDQSNAIADIYSAGKGKYTSRQFQFDTDLRFDFGKWVKGLTFQTNFGIDYRTSYNTSYNYSYATYEPTWANYNGEDVIISLTKYNNDKTTGVENISGSYNKQTIMWSGQFDYVHDFGLDHHFNAKLLAWGYQQQWAGSYHRTSNANLGLELGYNYKNRYFAQFDAAEVWSAKLAPGRRDAFSPSLTLGWKIKNEPWMQNAKNVDDLTVSVSLSNLHEDIDVSNYYLYAEVYNQSDGAWWGWKDGVAAHSTQSKRGGNRDLTFVRRNEISATVNGSFFDHLLEVDASFWNTFYDGGIITSGTSYPSYFSLYWPSSSFIPYINYNRDRRTGFDVGVKLNKTFGDVELSLGANYMYYTTRACKRDEVYTYSYQNREGRPIDAIFGLKAIGFYQDQDDVDNSPKSQFSDVQPGDIKYEDVNGDNVIDSNDEVYLGKGGWWGSPSSLGLNFTAKYKGFTLFALVTGGWGAKGVKNSTYYWVYGDRKYSEEVLNRWTPETAETATYPRLTTLSSDNNFRTSTFWMYSTDRMDLQKVQLTYDFPKKLFRRTLVKGLQVYLSGNSLLTISGHRKLMETNIGSAPQYRNYNLGVYVNL
jgi:TonB-linked SusC/RagA family outer membrane protein